MATFGNHAGSTQQEQKWATWRVCTFVPFDAVKDVAAEIEMAMKLSIVATTHLARHHQL